MYNVYEKSRHQKYMFKKILIMYFKSVKRIYIKCS